jgi:hypothetical protein
MARLARVVVPGYPHHITQRGNRRLPHGTADKFDEFYTYDGLQRLTKSERGTLS